MGTPLRAAPMTQPHNPQAEQMAHESMLRNLAAQASAIWPQEQPLLARYAVPPAAAIADIGCGSGEITSRLAVLYPQAELVGIDILESSVAHARRRHAALSPRVRFEQGDAFDLRLPDARFDLVVCRHMTQSIPEPQRALAELVRICRPGGWVHVLSEDYGMLHMTPGALDPDRLWREGVIPFAQGIGTDNRIGRRTWALLHRLGLEDLWVDYIIVDTLRVPRETFAAIIDAWRDGYVDAISAHTQLSPAQTRGLFEQISASIRDPDQYAVWHIPVIGGRRP
jgi:ubiquinone/menaquinone biosynthesis C-methylase UbiE